MPDVSFDAQWFHIPSYRFEEFRPEDVPILVPLLRHSCALRYVAEAWDMDHFRAVRQHLADAGHAFLAKSVDLDSQDKDGLKVIPSLQLVAGMDASELDLQLAFEGVAPAIFAREELLRFKRFYLSIGVSTYAI